MIERLPDELGERQPTGIGGSNPSLLVVRLVAELGAGQMAHEGAREEAPSTEFVRSVRTNNIWPHSAHRYFAQ